MPEQDPIPSQGRIASVDEVVKAALRPRARVDLVGAGGSALAAVVARLARTGSRPVVAIARDDAEARRLADDARYFCGELPDGGAPVRVLLYPEHDLAPYSMLRADRRTLLDRVAVLSSLVRGRHEGTAVLVLSAAAAQRLVVPRSAFERFASRVALADEIDRDALVERLVAAGYRRAPLVEERGTLAVRGGLIDVYPPAADEPLRVELDGDLVSGIRTFDPETQRTTGSVDAADLDPASEVLRGPEELARCLGRLRAACDEVSLPSSRTREMVEALESRSSLVAEDAWLAAFHDRLDPLWRYVDGDPVVLLGAPEEIGAAWARGSRAAFEARQAMLARGEPSMPAELQLVAPEELRAEVDAHGRVLCHSVAIAGPDPWSAPTEAPLDLQAAAHDLRGAAPRDRASDVLGSLLRRVRQLTEEEGCSVRIVASSIGQAERRLSMIRPAIPATRVAPDPRGRPRPGAVEIVVGDLRRGVHLPAEGAAWIAEEEIFGRRARRRRAHAASGQVFEDLAVLEEGQKVVHVEYGIGRYLGLVRREVNGIDVEFLRIEYLDGDRLYVPVHRLNQVHRYVGAETVKLDRLGGQTFARRKKKAKRSVEELADHLLRIQASRRALPGTSVGPADPMYVQLEATFPFEETAEQQRAIDEVDADLESERVMDRVVCGDVGFGKTEVAIRAAFRVATAGRQVAVLVPTTVLAQQHHQSFCERLRPFPVVVETLSRFRSEAEQAETIRKLKTGGVDIVIGTHRLLSKDVHFKDLGLLVIDEEHRFGVEHKERVKKLKTQVDVLAMSATPIPRTLQMAMSALRDLSLITTPPEGRRPVRTYVTRYDEATIAQAIRREHARGGRVFYVRNRVQGLRERADRLAELVPEARFALAHGQMPEARLEQAMIDFVTGRVDVLVCTTIIESGLDVPGANTVIIERADQFGLAQLYHVRGRVGRSTVRAYAYLLVPADGEMTEDGRKRIAALQRMTELGSGFALATMDLEIRGAGELLGVEQSGHVAEVGYQMYVDLLEQAVAELAGKPPRFEVEPELSFDVAGFIPEDHVPDTGQRLVLYQRLASLEDPSFVGEVAAEMRDRFGPAPRPLETLYRMMEVKALSRRLGALGVEGTPRQVTVHLSDRTPLRPQTVLGLVTGQGGDYRMTPDMRLRRRLPPGEFADGVEAARAVVEELLAMDPPAPA